MDKSLEEILEAVWIADEAGDSSEGSVSRCCPIDVTGEYLDTLAGHGLVVRNGDQLELTEVGRSRARGIVRRHRLAVVLFTTMLDMDADKREAIACEAEHTLLPEVEESICTLLGHPTHTPDGKSIPPGKCCAAHRTTTSTVIVNLTALKPGEKGRINYIKPKDHGRLHKLTSFGLIPGTIVELHQRSPAFCIRYEGTEIAIDRDVAEDIFVSRINCDCRE